MTTVEYRDLTGEHQALLEQATLGNLNWSGERFTLDDVRNRPEYAHYTRLLTGRGDFGVVASRGQEPVGVAWALLLPLDAPGYGFVDAATPEVSLWVAQPLRRQGIGRALLQALAERAVARHHRQLSLSVESGNHARQLYLAEGFQPVPGREADGVMLKALHS